MSDHTKKELIQLEDSFLSYIYIDDSKYIQLDPDLKTIKRLISPLLLFATIGLSNVKPSSANTTKNNHTTESVQRYTVQNKGKDFRSLKDKQKSRQKNLASLNIKKQVEVEIVLKPSSKIDVGLSVLLSEQDQQKKEIIQILNLGLTPKSVFKLQPQLQPSKRININKLKQIEGGNSQPMQTPIGIPNVPGSKSFINFVLKQAHNAKEDYVKTTQTQGVIPGLFVAITRSPLLIVAWLSYMLAKTDSDGITRLQRYGSKLSSPFKKQKLKEEKTFDYLGALTDISKVVVDFVLKNPLKVSLISAALYKRNFLFSIFKEKTERERLYQDLSKLLKDQNDSIKVVYDKFVGFMNSILKQKTTENEGYINELKKDYKKVKDQNEVLSRTNHLQELNILNIVNDYKITFLQNNATLNTCNNAFMELKGILFDQNQAFAQRVLTTLEFIGRALKQDIRDDNDNIMLPLPMIGEDFPLVSIFTNLTEASKIFGVPIKIDYKIQNLGKPVIFGKPKSVPYDPLGVEGAHFFHNPDNHIPDFG